MVPRNSAPAACVAHALCLAGTQHIAQVLTLPFFFFCTKKRQFFFFKEEALKQNYRFYPDYAELMVKFVLFCFFSSCPFSHLFFLFLYSYIFFLISYIHSFQISKNEGKHTYQEIAYWRTEIAETIAKQYPVSSGALSAWIKSLLYLYLWLFLFFFPAHQCSGDWTSIPTDQCSLKWQLNSTRSGQIFC